MYYNEYNGKHYKNKIKIYIIIIILYIFHAFYNIKIIIIKKRWTKLIQNIIIWKTKILILKEIHIILTFISN